MSLRFACPHCRQKLSVGAHKAGTKANCPKCKQPILIPQPPPVPAPSTAGKPLPPSGLVSHSLAPSSAAMPVPSVLTAAVSAVPPTAAGSVLDESPPPFHSGASLLGMAAAPPVQPESPAGDFDAYMVYDDDTEIVYDVEQPTLPAGSAPSVGDRLLIPRWVVYAQGVALAVVATLSFVIGVLTGNGAAAPATVGPKDCKLYGTISFKLAGASKTDDGAVVVALPQKAAVDEKAESAELSPKKNTPPPTHRSLQIIRQLGGAYTRTDRQGKFELKLPQAGPYYVLVVSNNLKQKGGDDEKTLDLMQMGKFLKEPRQLLDKQRYQWSVTNIRGDQRLDASFE